MSLTVGLTLHLLLHGSAVLTQSQSDTVTYIDDLHSQIESFLLNIIGAYSAIPCRAYTPLGSYRVIKPYLHSETRWAHIFATLNNDVDSTLQKRCVPIGN